MTEVSGYVRKMASELVHQDVHYYFHDVFLNELIGYPITLHFLNDAACVSCGRKIKKTYQQGYCFPCTQSKAECDLCILKPELCHFATGTCREPEWGQAHCMQDHYVYLSNASGLKVGITRHSNIPMRFIDQGAIQALPIFRVKSRYHAGLIEIELAKSISDKTNWRKMLAPTPSIDLLTSRAQLLPQFLASFSKQRVIAEVLESSPFELHYPISEYPKVLKGIDLLGLGTWTAPLLGVKGQYLLFEHGVLNVRSLSGYGVCLSY